MIEGYKDMATFIKSEFGRTYTAETVRSWKYRYNLPIESVNGRAAIASDSFRMWYRSRIVAHSTQQ